METNGTPIYYGLEAVCLAENDKLKSGNPGEKG